MHIECTCRRCGAPFFVKQYRASSAQFCSYACFYGPRVACTCEQCGKSFERRPSAVSATNFCSKACLAQWLTIPAPERFWPKVDMTGDCWLWQAGTMSGYGAFRPDGGRTMGAHVWAFEQKFGPVPRGMAVLHTCDVRPCVRNDEPGIYVVNGIARPRYGHLFLGTKADNNRDMWDKGRGAIGDHAGARTKPESLHRGDQHWTHRTPGRLARGDRSGMRQHPESVPRGERNGLAKLTATQIVEIRRRWAEGGITQTALSHEYGVTQMLISKIVRREIWRHID